MASLAGQEPGTGEGPVRQARKCSQVCFADSAVDWTLLVAGKVSPEPKGAGELPCAISGTALPRDLLRR